MTVHPFRFDSESGPIYTAVATEVVWATTGGAPPAEYHSWIDFGEVFEGWKIEYVPIDDDVDTRINYFYLGHSLILITQNLGCHSCEGKYPLL